MIGQFTQNLLRLMHGYFSFSFALDCHSYFGFLCLTVSFKRKQVLERLFHRKKMIHLFLIIYYVVLLDNHPDDMKWNLSDGYVMVYKSLLLLGSNIRTDTISKRISYLSVMVGGMLLYWLWEAQLISYFSFPSRRLPFNNLEEFLANSDKKV